MKKHWFALAVVMSCSVAFTVRAQSAQPEANPSVPPGAPDSPPPDGTDATGVPPSEPPPGPADAPPPPPPSYGGLGVGASAEAGAQHDPSTPRPASGDQPQA